jgi:hypothetical protein
VTVGPNDARGWKVVVSPQEYVRDLVRDHPLLPLWALVLLAPVALVVVRRRRANKPYVEGAGTVEPPATPLDGRGETLLIPRSALRSATRSAPSPMDARPTVLIRVPNRHNRTGVR